MKFALHVTTVYISKGGPSTISRFIISSSPQQHHHPRYRYPSAITTAPIACPESKHCTRQSRANLSRRALSPPITTLHLDVNIRDADLLMTSVYSRSPLQLINMQSTQRPSRRRTTRHLFNDEEEPPAKRSKIEGNTANGTDKQANGKALAPRAKRQKRCRLATHSMAIEVTCRTW
jgi:hypothetical protein